MKHVEFVKDVSRICTGLSAHELYGAVNILSIEEVASLTHRSPANNSS
jgi:hypothetical protein